MQLERPSDHGWPRTVPVDRVGASEQARNVTFQPLLGTMLYRLCPVMPLPCGIGGRFGWPDQELSTLQAKGRARPGATVRARMPSVARSAPSGMTGKIAASFQLWSTDDQS